MFEGIREKIATKLNRDGSAISPYDFDTLQNVGTVCDDSGNQIMSGFRFPDGRIRTWVEITGPWNGSHEQNGLPKKEDILDTEILEPDLGACEFQSKLCLKALMQISK